MSIRTFNRRRLSNIKKFGIAALAFWAIVLFGLLLAPIEEAGAFIYHISKYYDSEAHFGLFFITGFISIFGARFLKTFRARLLFGCSVSLLLAFATEFAQSFVAYRTTSLSDLLADILGLLFAVICNVVLHLYISNKRP